MAEILRLNAATTRFALPAPFAAFNPTDATAEFAVESEIEKNFVQIADIDNFDADGIENIENPIANGILSVPPISVALFAEK